MCAIRLLWVGSGGLSELALVFSMYCFLERGVGLVVICGLKRFTMYSRSVLSNIFKPT
jgi:hypothetical protein